MDSDSELFFRLGSDGNAVKAMKQRSYSAMVTENFQSIRTCKCILWQKFSISIIIKKRNSQRSCRFPQRGYSEPWSGARDLPLLGVCNALGDDIPTCCNKTAACMQLIYHFEAFETLSLVTYKIVNALSD